MQNQNNSEDKVLKKKIGLIVYKFSLSIAFAVSHRFLQNVFSFLLDSKKFWFLSYFFNDPLIMQQYIVQSADTWIFSAVSFACG
jgi:hypothetical protein